MDHLNLIYLDLEVQINGGMMPVTEINEKIRQAYLVSGCVVEENGRYLLVQEKKPEVHGKWNLPAGKAEINLTLEENAVKEAKEETGLDVEIVEKIGAYYREGDRSVKFAFLARVLGGDISFDSEEILQAKWFDYNELIKMNEAGELRNFWVMAAIEDSRR